MPTLYVVATPIGNIEDITLRALKVLRRVGTVFCENPRHTKKLFDRYDIKPPKFVKYTEHQHRLVSQLIRHIGDSDAALVVDSGTPGISDPGAKFIAEARKAGIHVVAVPGPSALTAALSISGLYSREFMFVGFLPKKSEALKKLLSSLEAHKIVGVAYESPYRIKKTMERVTKNFPDVRVFIAKELTKVHEMTFWGSPQEALDWLGEPKRAIGEFVLVFDFSGRSY